MISSVKKYCKIPYSVVFVLCLILSAILGSCGKEKIYRIITDRTDLQGFSFPSDQKYSYECNENLNYAPDPSYYDHYDEKTIRVNIHYMVSEDQKVGFSEKKGREYMYYLLKNANERLKQNEKMKLPIGNDTPNLQPFYQYKVVGATNDPDDDGQYWHYDDELYYFVNKGKFRNNYNRDVIEKYEIGGDSILNIFVMPHHPDSVVSKTYRQHGTGIALNNSLKIAGLYENPDNPWAYATLLNHEIGHIYGLRHSWGGNDGCDDTPKHKNCWQDNPSDPDCIKASNNMMDYNNSQMAITPCQLGLVHKYIAKKGSKQRKFVVPVWCKLDESRPIIIDSEVHWKGARDISRNIIIKEGGSLHIYCRVSMPKNSEILVEPGGSLVLNHAKLHNDCGDSWKGIRLMKKGSKKAILESHGEVTIDHVIPKT